MNHEHHSIFGTAKGAILGGVSLIVSVKLSEVNEMLYGFGLFITCCIGLVNLYKLIKEEK